MNTEKIIIDRILPSFDVYVCGGVTYFTMFEGDCGSDTKNMVYNRNEEEKEEVFFTPLSLPFFLNAFARFVSEYYTDNVDELTKKLLACNSEDISNIDNFVTDVCDYEYGACFSKFVKSVKAFQIHNFRAKYETCLAVNSRNFIFQNDHEPTK